MHTEDEAVSWSWGVLNGKAQMWLQDMLTVKWLSRVSISDSRGLTLETRKQLPRHVSGQIAPCQITSSLHFGRFSLYPILLLLSFPLRRLVKYVFIGLFTFRCLTPPPEPRLNHNTRFLLRSLKIKLFVPDDTTSWTRCWDISWYCLHWHPAAGRQSVRLANVIKIL